ncbi:hypothetical protein JYG30_10820 [Fibrella sp. USSR17]
MPPSSTVYNSPSDAVNNASNKIILRALKNLKKHQFSKNRLIGPRNFYRVDTTKKTDDDTLIVNKVHLSEYIAASTFTHCFDGWNFLSRGVESLLNGDIPSCIHFVYYSELRAVMSLMACEGIGVFNSRHFYFDHSNNLNTFRRGTHTAAQQLIDDWSKLRTKKNFVFQNIKISTTNLGSLIDATGISTTSPYASSILNDWFVNWSLDLRLSQDKDLRNEMSYRPHFEYKSPESSKMISGIAKIWSGLEPTSSINFLDLDRHLVRIAFERLFVISTGKKVKSSDFKRFVAFALGNIGEGSNNSLSDFLIRKNNKDDHFILQEARKAHVNNNVIVTDPLPMICRAVLLLRMASGSVNSNLTNCFINSQDLKFWWEGLALGFGITNSVSPNIDTSDLFTDIQDAINNVQANLISPSCTKDNIDFLSSDINTIKQFQRTCFWGIGL